MHYKMDKMIEEKTLSLESAILLLKSVGYCKALKNVRNLFFDSSSLSGRFQKMIIDEKKKKEVKNDKLLIDLCECYLLHKEWFSSELLSICVPCLLKAALMKEENEDAKKEAEMALLSLNYIRNKYKVPEELYLDEIKEIIQHHQKRHNLTHLSYQSAWQFMINRFHKGESLEEMIVNELHFMKEAAKELEELEKCVDWKRYKEENGRIEVHIIWRWLYNIDHCFLLCKLWNEETTKLIRSIVELYREAKDYYRDICNGCAYLLRKAEEKRVVNVEILLKKGAIDCILEGMVQSSLDNLITRNCLHFFLSISKRLKEKTTDNAEEAKRKASKRKISEKMEDEGYKDIIVSFLGIFSFLYKNDNNLSLDISDYFVNV
ncbi:uncharacterized protein MONOS_18314 [Monocercomonoides exilis]|uniref:uncharacterized protein n=1 Tax=Monocercomonoides exilis TaxID=2049356 RepID=UPI003559814A|nr:hypothetical protein MONOS_18314 [Monocercomonoides exilis]